MATLVNNSSGNFTSSATWSLIDTNGYTNVLATQETGTTASTAAFVSSTNITPGIITIDGIGLKLATRAVSPTGTFSVRLFNATGGAAVAGTTVTINVADLTANNTSWVFFKFSAPVTTALLTNYNVQLTSSSANQTTWYRKSATAGDWTYFLRTTTNQAPAAGDQLLICGDFVSAGVNNTYTVTMNNTAATAFGPATTGVLGMEINTKGVLSYGTATSTAYQLRMAGNININQEGTLNIGTSGTPIPASSSAALEFIVTSNVQFGLNIRTTLNSTFNAYGATKTGRANLAADAAAAATTLTTDVSTGWLSGDSIVVAGTNRAIAESEQVTLSANATGASVPISALSFAHSGTAPTKAEVINLTRNVKIFGQSTALQSFITIGTLSVVNMQYVELFFMGSASANTRGVGVLTTTGSTNITGCAFRNFEVASSMGINTSSSVANTTINDCVFYRMSTNAINTGASTSATLVVSNCTAIANLVVNNVLFSIGAASGSFTNLTAVSAQNNGISATASDQVSLTLSGFVSHTNGATGVTWTANSAVSAPASLSNVTVWRNNTRGLFLSSCLNFSVDTVTSFGNVTDGVEIASCFSGIIKNITANAGVTFTQPVGILLGSTNAGVFIDNSMLGTSQTHATGDIQIGVLRSYHDVIFRNTLFGSTTQFATQSSLVPGAMVGSAKNNQTAGQHRLYEKFGVITSDTTFFQVQSPSQRLTPNNANGKLMTKEKRVAVPSGKSVKLHVFVRKSVAGDGSAYNGNQPRLILKADPAAGIASDVVLASSTVAGNGAFEELVATTSAVTDDCALKFYIDCDGTAGWVNVDRWIAEIV